MNKQRKIASKVLKCGIGRVWIDPKRLEDVANAITRRDIEGLIKSGLIKKINEIGISSGRRSKVIAQKKKGGRKGRGSRKGSTQRKKKTWIKKIRSLRRYLKLLRERGLITKEVFGKAYRISASGYFKDKNHLKIYLERNNLISKVNEKK